MQTCILCIRMCKCQQTWIEADWKRISLNTGNEWSIELFFNTEDK